jgi:hypothetical protein
MRIKQLTALIFLMTSMISCTIEEGGDHGDPNQPLVFTSLTAEKATIAPGESIKITAVATGYRLTYTWTKTAGDILGSGSQVVYAVSPCHLGTYNITCTVTDGKNVSQSKEVTIVVE